ncbi:hypothetical protein D3P07_08095 [Paenibacillus sp. 1011MAR3C5]|uniref:hypothetical protein n=1 Tax=Paenibacillus sp. 1011MAR3C5 TaxID=1675787 RepID=UPI000E6CD142|nr:hypothetical protein [Paenibacillus sp. 1011MAR3C5]RJE90165.1 hypothetical protein D3P07_08095 [Paenibacillus sp. 1011MAR3C5]
MHAAISGQLVIADRVTDNYEARAHCIQNVRNVVHIRTFPSVTLFYLWAKVLFYGTDHGVVWIKVYDADHQTVWEKKCEGLVNKRVSPAPAGLDMAFQPRFVVHEEGLFHFVMTDADGETLAHYPLYIASLDPS